MIQSDTDPLAPQADLGFLLHGLKTSHGEIDFISYCHEILTYTAKGKYVPQFLFPAALQALLEQYPVLSVQQSLS